MSKKDELIRAAINGSSFDDIVEKAACFLNNALVVINNSYNIIAYSKSIEVNDITWNEAMKRGYITLEFGATLNNWDRLLDKTVAIECITVTEISEIRRRFYKLTIHSQVMGYLNVTEALSPFEDTPIKDVELVLQILAKEIYIQQKMLNQNKTTHNEDILLELSSESYVNKLHFLERVEISNLNIKSNFIVGCIDLSNFLSYNAGEDTFKKKLLSFFPSGTIIITNHVLVILIDLLSSDYIDFSPNNKLEEYLREENLKLGISDYFSDLFEFKRYELQARAALDNQQYLFNKDNRMIHFEQVKTIQLLKEIPSGQLIYYCNQKIISIYDYDQKNLTDYFETLHVYLSVGKSVKMASSMLYLHRNTVNYRIQRIREIFNLDFDHEEMIHHWLLSCQILQLLKEKTNHNV